MTEETKTQFETDAAPESAETVEEEAPEATDAPEAEAPLGSLFGDTESDDASEDSSPVEDDESDDEFDEVTDAEALTPRSFKGTDKLVPVKEDGDTLCTVYLRDTGKRGAGLVGGSLIVGIFWHGDAGRENELYTLNDPTEARLEETLTQKMSKTEKRYLLPNIISKLRAAFPKR